MYSGPVDGWQGRLLAFQRFREFIRRGWTKITYALLECLMFAIGSSIVEFCGGIKTTKIEKRKQCNIGAACTYVRTWSALPATWMDTIHIRLRSERFDGLVTLRSNPTRICLPPPYIYSDPYIYERRSRRCIGGGNSSVRAQRRIVGHRRRTMTGQRRRRRPMDPPASNPQ
jgi:hypothetical protein